MDKVQVELVSATRAASELESQLGDAQALVKNIVREAKNLKK